MTDIPPSLVHQATSGDRASLEELFSQIQGPVYQLAVRMLWCPEDAKDASQEVMIKVLTNLASFEGRSRFSTWVYKIAVNHLLSVRASRVERMELSWTTFAEDLAAGLGEPSGENRLWVEEVKVGCTHGMLLCLDRRQRMAYILGEIIEFTGAEASEVLGISPTAFRKRLSRARKEISDFTSRWCGLVRETNACRCNRRIGHAEATGRLDPSRLLFTPTSKPSASSAISQAIAQLDVVQGTAELYRSHGNLQLPSGLLAGLESLFQRTP